MNNLAKYRAKHGMTQTELGKLVGFTKAYVSFVEKGVLSPKNAAKFSEALHESMFDLMGADVLKAIPVTESDKESIIETIKGI